MQIGAHTRYYGVLGYPVEHSKSPLLFNHWFEQYHIDAVYLFLKSKNTKEGIESIRNLNFSGVSITIPHKVEAMKYLDEIDPYAKRLGCINTIINRNEKLVGYNYDGVGAVDALQRYFPNFFEQNILIIGNGGAALGIAMHLVLEYQIKTLSFLVRNLSTSNYLKKKLEEVGVQVKFILKDTEQMNEIKNYIILINTTPVGMHPKVKDIPLPENCIDKKQFVYDIIYNPIETRLIKAAKNCGSNYLTGDEMFLGQAARQMKLWTGIEIDLSQYKGQLFYENY